MLNMEPNIIPDQPSEVPVVPTEPVIQPQPEPQIQPQPQPEFQQPIVTQPVTQSVPIKKDKSFLIKLSIGLVMLVLIAGGVGAFLWRDGQANSQKSDDVAKVKTLNDKVAVLEDKIATIEIATGPISQEMLDSIKKGADAGSTQLKQDSNRALANAQTVQNLAEIYAADNGYYPAVAATFMTYNGTAKLPSGITVLPGTVISPLNPTNGKTNVTWACLTTCTKTTGGKITFWDFTTNTVSTSIVYVGAATHSSTFVAPKS